ncbi:MAG: hypothetical protein ACO1OQ_02000 [Rufibacter sp.]
MRERELNLPDIPPKHPFTVPDGYFEKLPTRVMQRTASAQPQHTALPVAWFRQYKAMMAGVTMALVFLATFFIPQYVEFSSPEPTQMLAQVSKRDIHQYLLTNVELESTEVAEIATVNPPQALEFIEVTHEDVPVEAAMELLQDESLTQSTY